MADNCCDQCRDKSDEHMIRMSLQDIRPSVTLEFDIPNCKVKVFHEDNLHEIQMRIESLNLVTILNNTRKIDATDFL